MIFIGDHLIYGGKYLLFLTLFLETIGVYKQKMHKDTLIYREKQIKPPKLG